MAIDYWSCVATDEANLRSANQSSEVVTQLKKLSEQLPQPTSGKQEQEWTADAIAMFYDISKITATRLAADINTSISAERERTEQFARAQAKANARLCELEPEVQQLREQLAAVTWELSIAQGKLVAAQVAITVKDSCLSRTYAILYDKDSEDGRMVKAAMDAKADTTILNEYVEKEIQKYISASVGSESRVQPNETREVE